MSAVIVGLLCMGAGCIPTTSQVPTEEATQSLSFVVGDELFVRPTVFGIGGEVVEWLGQESGAMTMQLTAWEEEQVSLSWKKDVEQETQDSQASRASFRTFYANAPIGADIPPEPEPYYETVQVEGTASTESLNDSHELSLPFMWEPESDSGKGTSLIWLSHAQYEELVSTRSTQLSLGLFDESLEAVATVQAGISSAVDWVTGVIGPIAGIDHWTDTDEAEEIRTMLTLEADQAFGEYTLTVNGERTKVQTIQAENAFATFTILANEENPLVLEIRLKPLAQGQVNVFTKEGLAEGFAGYEIYAIKKTDQ